MKLTVSSGGVPAGSYLSKFVGVERITNDFGPGLVWQWEVASGPHAGQKVTRITTVSPTPKNVCGKMLAGVIGKPLSAGEEIDLSACVGKNYLTVVAESNPLTRTQRRRQSRRGQKRLTPTVKPFKRLNRPSCHRSRRTWGLAKE